MEKNNMKNFLLLSTDSDETMILRCKVYARKENLTVIMVPSKSSFSVGSINFLPELEEAQTTGTTFLTDYQKMNSLGMQVLCVKNSFGSHIGCHNLYFVNPVISGPHSSMIGPLVVSEDSQGKIFTRFLMLDENFQLIDSENLLISF